MKTQKIAAPLDLTAWGQLLKQDVLQSMNCLHLGTIRGFDSDTQTATIALNYKWIVNGETEDYPPLADVPVVVLGGGAGHLTFPIAIGDSCLVFFNDVNLDRWVVSGNLGAVPENTRKHDFSDAVALVGIHAIPQALSDYADDKVRLHLGDTQIRLGAKIHLANTATDLKTVIEALNTILTTFMAALAALPPATPVVGSVLAAPGLAAQTALTTWQSTLLEGLLE